MAKSGGGSTPPKLPTTPVKNIPQPKVVPTKKGA
jgi:hypothetical protein